VDARLGGHLRAALHRVDGQGRDSGAQGEHQAVQPVGDHHVEPGQHRMELGGGAAQPPVVAGQPGVQLHPGAVPAREPPAHPAGDLLVAPPPSVLALPVGEDHSGHRGGGRLRRGGGQVGGRPDAGRVARQDAVEAAHGGVAGIDDGHAHGDAQAVRVALVEAGDLRAVQRAADEDQAVVAVRVRLLQAQGVRPETGAPGGLVRDAGTVQHLLHAAQRQLVTGRDLAVQEGEPAREQSFLCGHQGTRGHSATA